MALFLVLFSFLAVAAAAGCESQPPSLTLVFVAVPTGTTRFEVTLHGTNATFMGPDAGNADVGVSYMGGNAIISIDAGYAAARHNQIRLPLTAREMLTLVTSARAIGGAESTAVKLATLTPGQGVTLIFDFSSDGGTGPFDGGPHEVNADVDADVDATGDVTVDADAGTGTDASADASADVVDAPIDAPIESRQDTGADAPRIPTSCALGGQYAASAAIGGSAPAVAYSSEGVFGVAWKAPSGDILYNAVTPTGTLQLTAADKVVVSAASQSVSPPRLARIGPDLVMAYGRRDATGAQAAVVRIAPRTGAPAGSPSTGTSTSGAGQPPDIGGVAVTGDSSKLAVISRPPGLTAQTGATVDAFNSTLTFITARSPAALAATRTTGIGWAASRFMAGAVSDATSAGGTLLELGDDNNLTLGTTDPFTGSGAVPLVGSAGATLAIAGAGDRVAVAWIDQRTGTREIWIATISLSSKALSPAIQVSTESATTKGYPHMVFDGAAFALAWIEGDVPTGSRVKLARFDADLAPLYTTPLNVGTVGAVGLGDLDIAASAANAYGIAGAASNSTQQLFYVTCN